jgi:hypothetical protein
VIFIKITFKDDFQVVAYVYFSFSLHLVEATLIPSFHQMGAWGKGTEN